MLISINSAKLSSRWGAEAFPQFLKCRVGQSKMALRNFGNLPLKCGPLMGVKCAFRVESNSKKFGPLYYLVYFV